MKIQAEQTQTEAPNADRMFDDLLAAARNALELAEAQERQLMQVRACLRQALDASEVTV